MTVNVKTEARATRRLVLIGVGIVVVAAAAAVIKSHDDSKEIVAGTGSASGVASQRWLLPTSPATPTPGPQPSLGAPGDPPRTHEVSDGPVGTAVATIVEHLPSVATLRRDYIKDVVTDADGYTIAKLRFVSPAGGALTIVRQQLQKPIPLDTVTLGRPNAKDSTLSDGTEVVTLDEPSVGFSQEVFVTTNGMMTNVTSSGIPGKGVRQPLSYSDVVAVATALMH